MPECKLCGLYFNAITTSHLKYSHNGLTTLDYMEKFPGSELREPFSHSEETKKLISGIQNNRTPEEKAIISQRLSESHIGQEVSEETRNKHSEISTKFYENPEERLKQGIRMSEIMTEVWTRPEYRKAKIAQMSESSSRNWNTPEYRNKTLKSQGHKTSIDQDVISVILEESFPGGWKFVGDGNFEGPGSKTPDWAHTSLKKVIEYNCHYWHHEIREDNPEARIAHFKSIGYDCLILTDEDLWINSNIIIEKVKAFLGIPNENK